MTDKLTLSDCFKYPNASLINKLGLKCENLTEFISATDGQDLDFTLQDDGFKLILRDISELTGKEKNYIGKTMGLLSIISKDRIELIDYLRSINIDIDRFLECGKAVKE